MSVSVILLVIAIILFVIAALLSAGVISGLSGVTLVALGLAAFAAAHLPAPAGRA